MKKIAIVFTLLLAGLTFSSFTTSTKLNANNNEPDPALIARGKTLFSTKTCTSCHKVDTKLVGPSLKTIANTYKSKNASLLKFFKGESKSIVDPAMAAIMEANVQSITKSMKDDDLKALQAYIESTIK